LRCRLGATLLAPQRLGPSRRKKDDAPNHRARGWGAKNKPTIPVAHVEKDRSGVLAGQTIAWPNFDNIAKPLIGLLGTNHATAPTEDEVGLQDAEALARQETERVGRSAELAAQYTACFGLAAGIADLERMAKELTPKLKGELEAKDLGPRAEGIRDAAGATQGRGCGYARRQRAGSGCRTQRGSLTPSTPSFRPGGPSRGAFGRWWASWPTAWVVATWANVRETRAKFAAHQQPRGTCHAYRVGRCDCAK
jgi:hypothetical protein